MGKRGPKASTIPKAARTAWETGDRERASQLAGLSASTLYARLGTPGTRPPSKPASASSTPAAPTPAPPPAELEPTADEIARVDTREEALATLRLLKGRLAVADDVRFASLAGKVLDAINRLEQIDRRRPQPPTADEVTARIVAVRDAAIARIGLLTSDAAAKLARDREAFATWCAQTLAPAHAAEVTARVNAMLGGSAA